MSMMIEPWDYLIVTASNDRQAEAYRSQLALRQQLDLLCRARHVMVVADPEGKRVGSGGSTVYCLMQVLTRELAERGGEAQNVSNWTKILAGLRILIVHAGGDSRRLPAYGPCGKIFVPVPGDNDYAVPPTLFDRQLPTLLALPAMPDGGGQVVVVGGDALLDFDPKQVRFESQGITGLGALATPEAATKHGVFCTDGDRQVRLFLQKPSLDEQRAAGAIDRYGQSILDVALMSFDVASVVAMLKCFDVTANDQGELVWPPVIAEAILTHGVDLYREICCALGTEATAEHHRTAAHGSGSTMDDGMLQRLFDALRDVPFSVQTLPQCGFLHFGTTRQLITSGHELVQLDRGKVPAGMTLQVNNDLGPEGKITGDNSWVEGCRVNSTLQLGGENVCLGANIDRPVTLPPGACLDVLEGSRRDGRPGWFVRCYGLTDQIKDTVAGGAAFCGIPLSDWLDAVGAEPSDVWPTADDPKAASVWDAQLFPAEDEPDGYHKWLWMFDPAGATDEQKEAWRTADRYSIAEMAVLADQDAFHARRSAIRAGDLLQSPHRLFACRSSLSAEELAWALKHTDGAGTSVAQMLVDAHLHHGDEAVAPGMEVFVYSRIIHSVATAVSEIIDDPAAPIGKVVPGLCEALPEPTASWLRTMDLELREDTPAEAWAEKARTSAFMEMSNTILASSLREVERPRFALHPEETVWGRAPARLELGGGWTDTPPFTLENGGAVINSAINLNGQPPIHVYARVVEEPVIRLSSIDLGSHIEITELDELLDYRRPGDGFALVKASLAIAGFSPDMADWPAGITLREMLREFGGGIELTTLVGIPKGSGLGTSSIVGATIIGVIQRVLGRTLDHQELFHHVLRLEQALTTGGGWQDQVGGGIGGTKLTTTQPGLFPDPIQYFVPSDLLDPKRNGGSTLLYYTGMTRLAKNILQQVVGGYLNRNRSIMTALADEFDVARAITDAMSRKDAEAFGHYINEAWRLQQQLCQDVNNETIQDLLDRIGPHIFGARISGAGSGGFMMMICKSPGDAAAIRRMLEEKPLNKRSRFFDFNVSDDGLVVTSC